MPTTSPTRTRRCVSFLWAHVGWLLVKQPEYARHGVFARYAKDVLRDPFYRKLENGLYYFGIIYLQWVLFFAVPFAASRWLAGGTAGEAAQLGLSVLVWGVFVRTVLNLHNTWAVNSVTHMWGYRNYETDEHSRNNLIVGYTRWARAGTTTITPIRARPATAIAGGSSTSPI